MPLIRIDTTVSLDRPTRTSLGALATQKIVQHWSVAPDKIQVLVTAKDPDSAFRAGVCPEAEEFGEKSRTTDSDFAHPYIPRFGDNDSDDLVIVSIDTWSGFSFKEKHALVSDLTQEIQDLLRVPGDNVIVLIHDMSPENWYQNGVSGRDQDFLSKSRAI